ncbi:pectin acetylesterase 8-like [Solanum dulcamara]|uniref:pectin acetylesterase 8-like n=1 Tax=Solanum dulcamara TaxID=45834 RepID=UPI0024856AD1|nr:pectin acetylesterase 8-like [Solanum dulcamara]
MESLPVCEGSYDSTITFAEVEHVLEESSLKTFNLVEEGSGSRTLLTVDLRVHELQEFYLSNAIPQSRKCSVSSWLSAYPNRAEIRSLTIHQRLTPSCPTNLLLQYNHKHLCAWIKTFHWVVVVVVLLLCTTHVLGAEVDLYVNITIVESATAQGAVCLDGSPPAYHLHRGHGNGLHSWIIYLDGGGWCNSILDCLNRSTMYLGSTKKMDKQGFFAGILHNTSKYNPEFYNWNRVRVKYCDGSSFTGDVEQVHPENKLYFRGARIFKAIMEDLWSKGMKNAENAILSGTSAGELATILNCDKFKCLLPENARVKCVADPGFFINGKTIYGTSHIQEMYQKIVNLHGSAKNLPSACTSAMEPSLCFFPQNIVPYIQTPLFIINSIYDTWQITKTLVPAYLDPQHAWKDCINNTNSCTFSQRIIIQVFGVNFLKTFEGLPPCFTRGYFLTSCYSHGLIVASSYWFSGSSPRLLNKTIAEAVADWYFERAEIQYRDPYPFVRNCPQ